MASHPRHKLVGHSGKDKGRNQTFRWGGCWRRVHGKIRMNTVAKHRWRQFGALASR